MTTTVHTRITADATQHLSQFERANAAVLNLDRSVQDFGRNVQAVLGAGGVLAAWQMMNDEIAATIQHYNKLVGITKGSNFFGSLSEARAMSMGLKDLATNAEAAYGAMRLTAAGAELMTRQFRALGEASRGLSIAINMPPQEALMRFQGFLIRGETEALEATGVSIKLNDLYDRYARDQGMSSRFQLGSRGEMMARQQELFAHPAFERMRAFGESTQATGFQQFRTMKQEAIDRFVVDLASGVDKLATSMLRLADAQPRETGDLAGRVASLTFPAASGGVAIGATNLMFTDRQNMMRNMLANQQAFAVQTEMQMERQQQRLQVASFRRQDLEHRYQQAVGLEKPPAWVVSQDTGAMLRFDQTTRGAGALASEDAARSRMGSLQGRHAGITGEIERGNAALARSQRLYTGLIAAEIGIMALATAWQAYTTAVRDAEVAQTNLKRNLDETINTSREIGTVLGGADRSGDLAGLLKTHGETMGLSGGALTEYGKWIDSHIEQLRTVKQGTKEWAEMIQGAREAAAGAQLREDAGGVARTQRNLGWWRMIGSAFQGGGPFARGRFLEAQGMTQTTTDSVFGPEFAGIVQQMQKLDELARILAGEDSPAEADPTYYQKLQARIQGAQKTSTLQQAMAAQAGLPGGSIAGQAQAGIDRLILGADVSQLYPKELEAFRPMYQNALQRQEAQRAQAMQDEIASMRAVSRDRMQYARSMDQLEREHGLERDITREQTELQRQYTETVEKNRDLLRQGEDAMNAWVAAVPDWASQVTRATASLQQMDAAQQLAAQSLRTYSSSLQQQAAQAGATVGAEGAILQGLAGANRFDATAAGLVTQIRDVGLIDAQISSLERAVGQPGLQASTRRMLQDQLASMKVQRTQQTGAALGGLLGFAGNMQDIPEDQWKYMQQFLRGPYAGQLEAMAPHLFDMARVAGVDPAILEQVRSGVAPFNIGGGNAAALRAEFGGIEALSPEVHLVEAMGSLEQAVKNLDATISGDPARALGRTTPGVTRNLPSVRTAGIAAESRAPLAGGFNKVTSFFGSNRATGKHGGIDIAAPAGTEMVAYGDLVALTDPYNAGKDYGMMQGFLDDRGNVVYYVHGSGFTAAKGDRIAAGGKVGSVYDMKNPHLDMKFMTKAEWDAWQARGGGGLPPWRTGGGFDPLLNGYLGGYDPATGRISYTTSQKILPSVSVAGNQSHLPSVRTAGMVLPTVSYSPQVNMAEFPYNGGLPAGGGGMLQDWYLPCDDPTGYG